MNDSSVALYDGFGSSIWREVPVDGSEPLLDVIYQTVLDPRLWVGAMEKIADSIGGNSAWLSQVSVEDGSGSGILARIDPVEPQRYLDYYGAINPFAVKARPREHMSTWRPTITTEIDCLSRDTLAKDEYYNDFMLPQDVHGVLMIDLAADDFQICTLNINRGKRRDPFGRGEIEFVKTLHPHLIRAVKLGMLFSDMRQFGVGTAAALDQLTHGVIVVDARLRIRYSNASAEKLLDARGGLCGTNGRLTIKQPTAARRLEALIGNATSRDADARSGGSMCLQNSDRSPLVITISRLQANSLPMLASGPVALITIAHTESDEAALVEKLAEIYELTAAEIRVALALLGGATPRQAAHAFGVSLNTVRSQMASIFCKTGTSGQSNLSRLMVRLAR